MASKEEDIKALVQELTVTDDKFPTLYSLNKRGRVMLWTICIIKDKGNGVYWMESGLEGGKITKRSTTTITVGKNLDKKNATTPWTQALSEARSKWMIRYRNSTPIKENLFKKDKTVTARNRLQPMKLMRYDKVKARFDNAKYPQYKFPLYISPKYDGENRMAYIGSDILSDPACDKGSDPACDKGSIQWYTRQNVDDVLQEQLKKELEKLPKGYYVNVEVYKHGVSRQEIVSRASEEDSDLDAYVFDMFKDPTTPYKDRLEIIKKYIKNFKHLIPVISTIVNNEEELIAKHKEYIEEGYEGAIVRLPTSVYEPGRRTYETMKYVAFHSEEFLITGFEDGTGSDEGVIKFILETGDGISFKSATFKGYTKDQLKKMYDNGDKYIGKQATVYFACRTNLGLPTPATIVSIA